MVKVLCIWSEANGQLWAEWWELTVGMEVRILENVKHNLKSVHNKYNGDIT